MRRKGDITMSSNPTIEAVVLMCSNDHRFIDICLNQLKLCVNKIHVAYFSHFWNGEEENFNIINSAVKNNKSDTCVFNKIDWTPNKQENLYWESYARWKMTQNCNGSDYIAYFDIDEIPDSNLFNEYKKEFYKYDSIRLRNYWYFREPVYRANSTEKSVVICKTHLAKSVPFLPAWSRDQYFDNFGNRIIDNKEPCIHHYSWVRTKQEMIKKVTTWGHKNDKDWVACVEKEFSSPFCGRDFVHGYSYTTVDNKFNISLID